MATHYVLMVMILNFFLQRIKHAHGMPIEVENYEISLRDTFKFRFLKALKITAIIIYGVKGFYWFNFF